MASDITNYQCPHCTGPVHFDSETGKVKCDYCDSIYTIEEIEALYKDKNEKAENAKGQSWNMDEAGDEWGKDGSGMKTYSCNACGAQLDCDETTAATSCPYCGNPAIIPGQLSGTLKPDYVIPFKVNREQAIAALKKHYENKPLLPKVFSSQNNIEKIQGVYVPFWLYDGIAQGNITYSGELHHTVRTNTEEITDIEEYRLYREGSIAFKNLPVDGSVKMNDALMDSIEPYDMSELKDFSLSYLPGFLADHFDVDSDESAKRADERAMNTVKRSFLSTAAQYSNVSALAENISLIPRGVKCALLPVWLLTTRWNNETYTFAMNGQTGKFVGNLPIDKKLYWKRHLITGGIIAAAVLAIQLISWFM